MKICFFSRCNLTYLYGSLNNALAGKYDIVHVAYSQIEYDILTKKFNIPENKIVLFKKELHTYLQKDYSKYNVDELDSHIITASNGRFNLNLSIQVDRGLKYKSYQDSEKLIIALYEFWNDYFEKEKPNIVVHEMVSLSINHICSVVAKERNILYVNEVQAPGLNNTNILFVNYWGGTPIYFKEPNLNIKENVKSFINNFKTKKQKVLLGNMFKNKSSIYYLFPAIWRYLSIKKNKNKYIALEDYIENFFANEAGAINKYENLKLYYKIKWDEPDSKEKYFYYPFHLEPEAAVFYWGDGIYSNQIKLIENIAASLPADTYLYVKDHPHDIGYRNVNDYLKLKQVNNIRLLYAKESGYDLIKNSEGVITINGSAGFEALLLDKPVYYFGNPYYENFNNVYKIKNIKDLRNILQKSVNIKSNLENFIKLFSNMYEGNCSVFYSENFEDKKNLDLVIKAFDSYFESVKNKIC